MHRTNRFEPRFFSEKARQISSPRLRPKLHPIPPLSLAMPDSKCHSLPARALARALRPGYQQGRRRRAQAKRAIGRTFSPVNLIHTVVIRDPRIHLFKL
jgi:hypothetical protein